MAEVLLSLKNTKAVLQQLADKVMEGYKQTLRDDDHITKYGKDRLVDTITTVVTVDGKSFSASLKMNFYWKYLEEGIQPAGKFPNPGWKSFPFILNWVQIKPVIPRPPQTIKPSKRTLESLQRQSAFLITRKRNDEGDEGTHGFAKTRDALVPQYIPKIQEALAKDIGEYLTLVFTR